VSGHRVLGLDPSLTSFGLAKVTPDGRVFLERVRSRKRGHDRINEILAYVRAWGSWCDLAVIEGLAFGAKGNALLELAGLQHLVRHELWNLGVPYAIVSPYTRAQYMTGRAGADKDEVLAAAIRRFPFAEITGNDTADALIFAAMGRHYLGEPIAEMPGYATELLTKVHSDKKRRGKPVIEWPASPAPSMALVTAAGPEEGTA
jgi:Holliday junction resolvasome RuvABC endonuclease subunit